MLRIHPHSFFSLFRKRHPLCFDAEGLVYHASSHVNFVEMQAAPLDLPGFFSSELHIFPREGNVIRLKGFPKAAAAEFARQAATAWRRAVVEEFAKHRPALAVLADRLEKFEATNRYPAPCRVAPLLRDIQKALTVSDLSRFVGILEPTDAAITTRLQTFASQPQAARAAVAARVVQSELATMADFFDKIEKNPLTPQQRLAVVTDEDATLVLAGAGSGKTSVIVAKAAYLIERGIRGPDEVLLMAFGKDAAAEMSERIKERTGAQVTARTFHALAYGIIAETLGTAPPLAPLATDDVAFIAELRVILADIVAKGGAAAELLVTWFSDFFYPQSDEFDFDSLDDYYSYIEAQNYRSLKGDLVRSREELEIANWLYRNGIAYDYEPDYEHPIEGTGRKGYTPDFRLTESGVYIEHFGVSKAVDGNGQIILRTAPYIDRKEYLAGMEWKRALHREHGTVLVETYSYDRREGGLSRALHTRLAPYVTLAPLPTEQVFDRLNELGQVDSFTRTLGTFLRHFKGAGKTIADCEARQGEGKEDARASAFLKLFARVYEAYQARLDTRIDFEDMINRATDLVKSGRYKSPFKHLLVDEFQDISAGRAELLLALKAQHADARIFAVGDDWQAIYRFAGADIHLMRAFGQKFGGSFAGKTDVHAVVDLGRTFRSVDRIALPARQFVLRNPAQIEKQVKSAGMAQTAAIRIAWCDRGAEDAQLEQVLARLNAAAHGAKTSTVLLLGRYRFLQPAQLSALSRKFNNLTLRFLTIHSSKGLEADHVIILGMRAGEIGMPSERIDDPILNLVLPTPELFRHAEERRVFYVALTRAKSSVTMIAQRQSPSSFVRELLEMPEYGVEDIGGEAGSAPKCPTCGGPMKVVPRASGNWLICDHERLCGTKLPACQSCGVDYPKVIGPDMMACSCGETPPACPKCNAWLVPRKGKFGEFYSCATYPTCDGKGPVAKRKGRRLR